MARLFGLSGRVTGRKGDTVFSVRKGEQIIRQYNPMVLNPNTEAQTVQRAKMKLSSQLGAVFANVVAIPSVGAKTARNQFTTINFPLITRDLTSDDIKVQADLPKIQLTNSGRAMCPIAVVRPGLLLGLCASLTRNCANLYDRVVYVMVSVMADGTMRVLKSTIVKDAGYDGRFPVRFADPNTGVLIYAYGIKDLSAQAGTIFNNTQYEDGTDVASLVSGRIVSTSDAQFTRTVGVYLAADAKVAASETGTFVPTILNLDPNHQEGVIAILSPLGSKLTLKAEEVEGYTFEDWTLMCGPDNYNIALNPYTWTVAAVGDDDYWMIYAMYNANE